MRVPVQSSMFKVPKFNVPPFSLPPSIVSAPRRGQQDSSPGSARSAPPWVTSLKNKNPSPIRWERGRGEGGLTLGVGCDVIPILSAITDQPVEPVVTHKRLCYH